MKRIDPKKLLPSSVPAGGSVGSVSPNILVPVSNITAKTYAKVEPEENTPQKSELRAQTFQIKSKLIEVSKLFSIKNKFTRDKNRKKRIEEERERREQREKESEKTTFNFGSKLPKLVLPRTGFLDSIKRFLLYSLLGFAVEKFLPLVPKLLEFGKMLIPAAQFLTDFAGNFLVNMVNFIDRGYKVYDGIKEQLDRIIPPDISKQFSKFSGVLNAALNAALILGTAAIGAGGPLGSKVGGKGVAGAATAATVAGIGISALVRKKIIARAIKNRAISSQQRQLKTDSLRSRRDAFLDIRKETLKERLKENARRTSERESRRTSEQVRSAIREARKKRLRDIIKSSERGASPQLLLRKAAASEELNRMYRSDANRAKLRRGIALQKGQRSRLMTVGDDVAIPFAKGQFFPKRMMPTRATERLRKYKMPFEEAVLSKPYGYNPNIVRFSDKFPTGYVDFRYGGKTKRMSQSSARYLSSLIENASAAERVNLPFASESREIATKFFNNPENYQSQVRSFAGEDITQMNRVYGKAKRKFTKEDVIGRREVSKPTRVSPTQEVSKGVSKFKFGRFRKAGPGIFGALLDIGISLATGEPLDRAVVSAIGSGLGGWIGAIVGSALPFIGTVAVGILGSTLGSIISLSLYDTIVGRGRNNRNVGRLTEDDKKKNREREIELEKYESGGILYGTSYGTSQVSPPQVAFGGVYSIENLVQLALSVGFKGENAAIAAAIAMAESGGKPNAHNKVPPDNSYGLWQINMLDEPGYMLGEDRRRKFGIKDNNELFNPVFNAQIAYKLSSGYNFGNWTTYDKPPYAYKTYLPAAKDALQKISSRSTGPVIYKPQSSLPQLPPTNTAHGQQYGARRRGGRQHAGVDFEISGNQTFYSRIGGKVIGIYYDPNPNGYGNYVDIYNDSLKKTERIAEGAVVLVKRGDVIQPGDAVVRGESSTGVIHYEIRKGRSGPEGDFSGTVDPINFLNNLPKEKASISKPSTTNITQGLDEETSYEDNNVKVVVLPIKEIIEKPVPIGGKGGGGFGIDINNNNIFAPALTG